MRARNNINNAFKGIESREQSLKHFLLHMMIDVWGFYSMLYSQGTRCAPKVQHRKHSQGCKGIKGTVQQEICLLGTRTFFNREQEFSFYV